MKKLFFIFVFTLIFINSSYAETRMESIIGTVTIVDTLKSSYIQKIPQDEKICQIREIPIYNQNQNQNNSELGSMIVGGLIGSAIGNKLSDKDGAGTFGAVTGAILGREGAKNNPQKGNIVGYRQEEVCETKRIIREEMVETISGYRFQIEADNRILTLERSKPLSVGDRIEINKKITYSLK